jgi:hypothetical protein
MTLRLLKASDESPETRDRSMFVRNFKCITADLEEKIWFNCLVVKRGVIHVGDAAARA